MARGFLAGQLSEDPRIQQGTPANCDPCAAGYLQHASSVGEGTHIAVADDRNALDRLDDGPDAIKADAAAEPLGTAAAVDRDAGDADALELPGEVRSSPLRVIPAEPHLDGHRNAHRVDDGRD